MKSKLNKLKLKKLELTIESKRYKFLYLFAQYDKDIFIRLLEFLLIIYFLYLLST